MPKFSVGNRVRASGETFLCLRSTMNEDTGVITKYSSRDKFYTVEFDGLSAWGNPWLLYEEEIRKAE